MTGEESKERCLFFEIRSRQGSVCFRVKRVQGRWIETQRPVKWPLFPEWPAATECSLPCHRKKKKRGCHPSCRPRSKKLSNNPNASLPCPFLFLFPRYIIRLKINIGNRSFPKIINHARRCAPWTHRELSAWKPPLSACEGEESTARKSRLKFHSSIKLYRGHR